MVLRGFEPWLALEEDHDVALFNANDPARDAVTLAPGMAEQLADSIMFHIRSNQLMAADPELLFRVRPNPDGGPVFGYTGINAQGFRSRPLERVEGRRRVVIVADSCGFGFGIRDHTLTIGFLLEEQLNRGGGHYIVYNLSQPGYSSAQARRLLARWLPVLEPHVVVLYLSWNDLWATPGLSDEATIRTLAWMRAGPLRFVTESRIWIGLRSAIRRLSQPAPGEALPALGATRPRVATPDAVDNHRAMLETARDIGASVLVIPPPFHEAERPRLGAMDAYSEALREGLEGEVPFVWLEPMRAPTPRARSYFQADGYHPNASGSRFIANELAARILALERS